MARIHGAPADLSKGTSRRGFDADSTLAVVPDFSATTLRRGQRGSGDQRDCEREEERAGGRGRRRIRGGKKRKKYTWKAKAERKNRLTEQTAGKPGCCCRRAREREREKEKEKEREK